MSPIRRDALHGIQRVLRVVLVVVVLALAGLGAHVLWRQSRMQQATGTATPTVPALSTPTAVQARTPRATASAGPTAPPPIRIGIVAGHWQHDSGAVCEDGLQEVDINLDVAQRVVALLTQSGFDAEILAEFAPELTNYQGTVLISIHTDSCSVPEATGFKVAHVSASVVPEAEDRLVACLIERYNQATGLPFHKNSITFDMTEYHAFYEIAPETPAAIIEIGFMAADRQFLTKKPDRVADGIVNGIKCFVENRP
jgi:N-acetylmuramoyl-L-alanine amidase